MEIDPQKFINSLRNLKDTVLGNDTELDACLRLCVSNVKISPKFKGLFGGLAHNSRCI